MRLLAFDVIPLELLLPVTVTIPPMTAHACGPEVPKQLADTERSGAGPGGVTDRVKGATHDRRYGASRRVLIRGSNGVSGCGVLGGLRKRRFGA